MVELIIGIILMVFAIIFLITSIIFSKSSKNKTDIQAEGEIVGYVREDYTRWDKPLVLMVIAGKENIYNCKSRRVKSSTFARGTMVNVIYSVSRKLGTDWYDVRIDEEGYRPYSYKLTVGILLGLALLILIISAVLIIIGVNSFV